MPSYAAFLGHQPSISLAEILAAIPGATVERLYGRDAAVFSSTVALEPQQLARLGGTVVLAEALADDAALEDIPNLLAKAVGETRGKVTFAVRACGVPPVTIRTLLRKGKDRLASAGRPSRYIGNEHKPAATALLRDTGLLDGKHGVEIVLLADDKKLWVGKTIAAQDPDAYTTRDMHKPVRDMTTGLLPPKLAQVLLNFGLWLARDQKNGSDSRIPKSESPFPSTTVYDPFCGTGVIPIECLLRGWPILASDASLKAVNGCTKNLEWARKQFSVPKTLASAVWKQDATKPFAFPEPKRGQEPLKPDVIVTETSLGPNLKMRPTLKDAQKLLRENEKLQEAFLKNAAACLPGVPVVVTWPVWYLRSGPLFLERAFAAASAAGFHPILPQGVTPSAVGRMSLLYRRPDQFVGREIVLLAVR
ncbi:MAG: hypothetical protein G01um101425_454 [Candidatus Peregrinibacteria bacterium Gr01-1014_25]|nr:MAG: hypothetical protein G01um101425_454 [Candidatus Peregrinibacteria bacterium Gr01-1014_25]